MANQLQDANPLPPSALAEAARTLDARSSPAPAEDELRVQRAHAEQLLEKSPAAIVFVDEQTRILRMNPAFTQTFGYTSVEALGKVLDDLIVPQEKKAEGQQINADVLTGKTVEADTYRQHKDGHRIEVSLLMTPIVVNESQIGYYAIYRDIRERKRSERLQAALYRIANLASSTHDLRELYAGIHAIVGELMYARNFSIAMYDSATRTLTFPFAVNELESMPAPGAVTLAGGGLHEYVARTGRPLLANPEVFEELARSGEVSIVGAPCVDWLGVPLKTGETTFGVISVQSYDRAHRYGETERELLLFVSQQIATALRHAQATQAIRESENKFRAVADLAPCAIFIYQGSRSLYVNQTGVAMTGYSREELARMDIWEIVHPSFRAIAKVHAAARERGEPAPSRYEFRMLTKQGQERWVDFSGRAIPYQGGTAVLGLAFDITDRKRAEEDLLLQRALLEQLFDASPEAVLLLNLDQRIIRVNQEFTRMFGFAPEEALGKTVDQLLVPPIKREEGERLTQLVVEGKGLNVETQRMRKDGSLIDVSVLGTPIMVGGRRVSYYAIYRDITKRKKAERELQELMHSLEKRVAQRTAELEEANHELESFSYSVSHDLRAPLRHIDGFVKLLMKRETGKFDATSARYFNDIAESSTKMGALIDDLLALSRTSRTELKCQSVDLAELFQSARSQLTRHPGKRKIVWEMGPLPVVEGDPALLQLVAQNLLSNAFKYTAPRSQARIGVGVASENPEEATIFVCDNGVGFDMQYVHKLFGVFQRLHREEEFEGTGIGLATVRRIILRHGGSVSAEAKLNEGATFYFTLRKAKRQRHGS